YHARFLDLLRLDRVVEGPAVERAGVGGLVAVAETRQRRTAVRTGVDEAVEVAILAAGDEHRLAADLGRVVVVHLGQLALVRQVDPVAFENVLHLEVEQVLVREHLTLAAEQALFLVFLDQGVQILLRDHRRSLRLWLGYGRSIVRRARPAKYPFPA